MADPGDAEAQRDLVVSLTKVAQVSAEPAPHYYEALAILKALNAEGRLSPEQEGWIGWVENQIASLPTKDTDRSAAE